MIFKIEKIILPLLIFLTPSGWLLSQSKWEWQNPIPQGASLLHILPLNEVEVVAVGVNGTVVRTNDRGEHWQVQNLDKTFNLRDLTHQYSNRIWTLSQEKVYMSEDKGVSWKEVKTCVDLSSTHYQMIRFSSPEKGWLLTDAKGITLQDDPVTHTGQLFKTTNGGDTWNVDPFVAITYPGSSNFFDPKAECGLIIGFGPVAIERAMDLEYSTGPAFTCIVVHLQVIYQLPAMIRP